MKRLFLLSLILSLTIHIILTVIFYIELSNKQRHLKYNPVYSVDIINLPKEKQKIKARREKHKISANINRAGKAKTYSAKEKIPMKMTTIMPKKLSSTVHIANKKQEEIKSKAEKKLATLQKSKMPNSVKAKHRNIKNVPEKKTKANKSKSIFRLKGQLFSRNSIPGDKNINGFAGGTSKEYSYKHASREATVAIGTQSIKYASYMKHIKDKVENVWIYPQDARENGMQGRLLVYFSISKNGSLYRLSLVRSSGSKILDDAAMQAIRDASPFPKLPDRLHLDRLNIYAAFEYKLVNYYVK